MSDTEAKNSGLVSPLAGSPDKTIGFRGTVEYRDTLHNEARARGIPVQGMLETAVSLYLQLTPRLKGAKPILPSEEPAPMGYESTADPENSGSGRNLTPAGDTVAVSIPRSVAPWVEKLLTVLSGPARRAIEANLETFAEYTALKKGGPSAPPANNKAVGSGRTGLPNSETHHAGGNLGDGGPGEPDDLDRAPGRLDEIEKPIRERRSKGGSDRREARPGGGLTDPPNQQQGRTNRASERKGE